MYRPDYAPSIGDSVTYWGKDATVIAVLPGSMVIVALDGGKFKKVSALDVYPVKQRIKYNLPTIARGDNHDEN